MVLNRENRQIAVTKAFQSLVVQVEVRAFDLSGIKGVRIHCETVVLTSDLDSARLFVQHRLVAPPMPELEFEGVGPAGKTEQLVSKANPKYWTRA